MSAGLEDRLLWLRASGARAFVPYVTAGLAGVDPGLLRALENRGADAIEVGIPFSDPVMDGPVIQEASHRAVEAGTTVDGVLSLVEDAGLKIPVVLMTYFNPVVAWGERRFAADAAGVRVAGAIVPDLPVDEASEWIEGCRSAGVATVFMAAPNSPPERLRRVAEASRGFVYCVASMGVTGSRERLAATARGVVEGLRPLTDLPLLVGVGISRPEQASEACAFADGVVVGSALVEPLLRGDRAEALAMAETFRSACRAG